MISGLLNVFLLHQISDLILAFVFAFIGDSGLLTTVLCEELSAVNSMRLFGLWLEMAGWQYA